VFEPCFQLFAVFAYINYAELYHLYPKNTWSLINKIAAIEITKLTVKKIVLSCATVHDVGE
jgi:hypothetical protein